MSTKPHGIRRRVRVFVASPGDVPEERDALRIVVEELRRTIGDSNLIDLELVRWETHTWPDMGADAQDVINREIGTYDIFVGVMWRKLGTPTRRADSGTVEEFDRAVRYNKKYGRPKIMFYFRTAPFYTESSEEVDQFKKVLAFKSKLRTAGALYWQHSTPLDFERLVREHLIRQISVVAEEIRQEAGFPRRARKNGSMKGSRGGRR